MSTLSPSETILAPLLGRLIDEQSPAHKPVIMNTRARQINLVLENIRENIELILNTRLIHLNWPKDKHELTQSIVNYGLPDFTHSYFANQDSQTQLLQEIRQKISIFEPRLNKISVVFLDNDADIERVLKLRIDAIIEFEYSHLPTSYESDIDMVTQLFHLKTAG